MRVRRETGRMSELALDDVERHALPRDVVFVDAIPRNPTGKILRRELPGG